MKRHLIVERVAARITQESRSMGSLFDLVRGLGTARTPPEQTTHVFTTDSHQIEVVLTHPKTVFEPVHAEVSMQPHGYKPRFKGQLPLVSMTCQIAQSDGGYADGPHTHVNSSHGSIDGLPENYENTMLDAAHRAFTEHSKKNRQKQLE